MLFTVFNPLSSKRKTGQWDVCYQRMEAGWNPPRPIPALLTAPLLTIWRISSLWILLKEMERSSALQTSWKNFIDIKRKKMYVRPKSWCVYRATICWYSHELDLTNNVIWGNFFLVSVLLLWKFWYLHYITLHCLLEFLRWLSSTYSDRIFKNSAKKNFRSTFLISSLRFTFLFSVNIHYQILLLLW